MGHASAFGQNAVPSHAITGRKDTTLHVPAMVAWPRAIVVEGIAAARPRHFLVHSVSEEEVFLDAKSGRAELINPLALVPHRIANRLGAFSAEFQIDPVSEHMERMVVTLALGPVRPRAIMPHQARIAHHLPAIVAFVTAAVGMTNH